MKNLEAWIREAVRDEDARKKRLRIALLTLSCSKWVMLLTLISGMVWVVLLAGKLDTESLASIDEWSDKIFSQLPYIGFLIYLAVLSLVVMVGANCTAASLIIADELQAMDKEA